MFRKRFYVKIKLQLHAITCPGVWLCKHGYLEATIKTLGYIFRTGSMEPRFPLFAHDEFTIEGYFKSVGSMEELERVLASEQVEIALWQSGRRLAHFMGRLADVMQAGTVPKYICAHNINVQLLMKATPAFPGIIAPKVELTVSIALRDRLSTRTKRCSPPQSKSSATSQRSISYTGDFIAPSFQMKAPMKRNRHTVDGTGKQVPKCYDYLEERRRQQTVCHARHCCGSRSEDNRSTPQCVPSTTLASDLFEANAIKHKNLQRRLSTCSSQSMAFTQDSSFSSQESNVYCMHSWSCDPNIVADIDADEHQERCQICQSYRRAFHVC